jgi:outer membrane murein-binding lipoprotein Lpp
MNQRHRRARQEEIARLSTEVKELSAQLHQLILEEEGNHQQQPQVQASTELKEGDRVEITNSYQGLKGAIGVIVHITAKQVSIKVKGRRRIVQRKKTNVLKLPEEVAQVEGN